MNKETNYNANAEAMIQSFAYIECLIYCFYPILSIILITIASIFKSSIDYYAEYTEENLNVVPALVITAGCFGTLFLLLRIKMSKANHMYAKCLVVFPTLILLQTIALVYGCVQTVDNKNYLKKAFQRDMGNIFTKSYYSNKKIETRFNIMQNELECCGVFGPSDYTNQSKLPISCCPAEKLAEYCSNSTNAYDVGCSSSVYEEVTSNIGLLSYITIGLVVLQILIGAIIGNMLLNHIRLRSGYRSM